MPFGSIGLTLFGIDLWWATSSAPAGAGTLGAVELIRDPAYWRIIADLALIGIFGGFISCLCMRSSRWIVRVALENDRGQQHPQRLVHVVAAALLAIALFH